MLLFHPRQYNRCSNFVEGHVRATASPYLSSRGKAARFRFSPSHQEWFCMKKAYRYRLYPTKKQETILNQQLALCCELYNAALQERRDAYRLRGKSISFTHQSAQLPEIKAIRASVRNDLLASAARCAASSRQSVHSLLQTVPGGADPRPPRFKSRHRYDSLTYPQTGFGIDEQGKLSLSKIGHLKMVQHRPFKGVVKTCTITRSSTGKWFVCFSCDEVAPTVLPASSEAVGIDVGLKTFAYRVFRLPDRQPTLFPGRGSGLSSGSEKTGQRGEGDAATQKAAQGRRPRA